MELSTFIKSLYYSITGWLLSSLIYFMPIKDLIHSLAIMFLINFILGLSVGLLIQGERLCFKKAKAAFTEMALYLVLLGAIFTVGRNMRSEEWIFSMLSWVTWAWHYFYLVNILKNSSRLVPHSKGFRFAYYVFSLEFVKNIPYLSNFEKQEKKDLKKNINLKDCK